MYKKTEKIHIVIQDIKNNLNKLPLAVKKAGISLPLWYLWEKKDPSLHKLRKGAEKVCEESRTTAVIDANFKSALAGNVAAQCFYLKNKAGWTDGPLIDQSQHRHVTYVWKDSREDSNSVFTPILPTGNSQIEQAIQGRQDRPSGREDGTAN